MLKLFGFVSLILLALTPAPAWACGGDGEAPCGGVCDWITEGYCPFCIPWCSRQPYFCHQGYKVQWVSIPLGPDVFEAPICRPIPTSQPTPVTVAQALAAGCRSEADVTAIVNEALSNTDLGTTTRTKLTTFKPSGGWATRLDVTDPDTWVYRAATIIGEEAKLTQGRLTSKAERRLQRAGDVYEFWKAYGPQVDGTQRDSTSLALQMLATSSSDEPPSQFASVALDFSVASGFGNIIYRFQLNPQSPVLGLGNCKTSGEVQLQPPGGTPIRNLRRYDRSKGYWEQYKAGVWVQIYKDEI